MPSIKVGAQTLIASVTDRKTLRETVEGMLQRQLAAAEKAFQSGNLLGLAEAVELLNAHRPDRPWPQWVRAAVGSHIARQRDIEEPTKQRGRHSSERTKRRDDAVDCIRATLIDQYAVKHDEHLTREEVCALRLSSRRVAAVARIVSRDLRGDAGGSSEVLEKAYKRFHDRVRHERFRYYPLLDWRAHVLLRAAFERDID